MAGQQDSTHQSAFFNDNALKLGVFCLNVSGGMMLSGAAKPKLEWDEKCIRRQGSRPDWLGVPALAIGRWRGHGKGKYNANAEQYECFTWAAAVAALTSRIHVFFWTCHVPIFHPVLAAKMSATVVQHQRRTMGSQHCVRLERRRIWHVLGSSNCRTTIATLAAAEWLGYHGIALGLAHGELDYQGKIYQISKGIS